METHKLKEILLAAPFIGLMSVSLFAIGYTLTTPLNSLPIVMQDLVHTFSYIPESVVQHKDPIGMLMMFEGLVGFPGYAYVIMKLTSSFMNRIFRKQIVRIN